MIPIKAYFLYERPIKVVTQSNSPYTKSKVPSKGSTQTHKSSISYSVLTLTLLGVLLKISSVYILQLISGKSIG